MILNSGTRRSRVGYLAFKEERKREDSSNVQYTHDQHSTYTIKYNLYIFHIAILTLLPLNLTFQHVWDTCTTCTCAPYITILLVLLQYRYTCTGAPYYLLYPVPLGTTTNSKSVYPILLSFYPSFYHQVRSLMNLVVSQVLFFWCFDASLLFDLRRWWVLYSLPCMLDTHCGDVFFSFQFHPIQQNHHTDAIFSLSYSIQLINRGLCGAQGLQERDRVFYRRHIFVASPRQILILSLVTISM